ncbi:hypothetical protein AB1N83_009550 [Pleurotus pulmonarius]|nr:hypothetical protein EYR36_004079 [Pleurotus pulmonarius]KAF4581633.1 hypothetical protein EYR38_002962 [Pleurotus pulmonarius]
MPGYLKAPRATVHDMPPEVLSRIFTVLASDSAGRMGFSLDWITVTHVCKFWYQVARDNPTLWSSINFIHPRWAQEKLIRAKSVPLHIDYHHGDIDGSEKAGKEALSLALNKMPLIKTAVIKAPFCALEGLVEKMCGLPAPIIEDFRLVCHDDAMDTSRRDLFSGIAPRLRRATFFGVQINMKTTVFRSVEVLILGTMRTPVPIPDFLALLANLPKLVELRTAIAFRQPDTADSARLACMAPVVLPNCQIMQAIGAGNNADVEQPAATPTAFLKWVTFAQPVDLTFVMSWYCDELHDNSADAYEQVFGPLDSFYSSHDMQFVELDVVHSIHSQMDDVKEQLDLQAQSKNGTSILLTFWFLDEVFPEDRAPLAEEFAQRLPRDDLKSINIDTVDIGAHIWHSLFGELKHLEEIRAYLYGSFFSALLKKDTHNEERCIFPSLSKLILYFDGEDEEKSERGCWERLPEVLEFRSTHGAPVREIGILPQEMVPQEYLAPIESFVAVHEWTM